MNSPNLFNIVNFDKMMIAMLQTTNGDNLILSSQKLFFCIATYTFCNEAESHITLQNRHET